MYDVIVVGGGPAGSAAVKRWAEFGLNTLILEKRLLPRNKVCSEDLPIPQPIISLELPNK